MRWNVCDGSYPKPTAGLLDSASFKGTSSNGCQHIDCNLLGWLVARVVIFLLYINTMV